MSRAQGLAFARLLNSQSQSQQEAIVIFSLSFSGSISLQIKEPISFIKVDIQGCDLFALQGAKETILKNKPAIIFEYEEQFQEEFNTTFNDYVEFVKSINYKFVKTYMDINYLVVPIE